jgi:hypothetical protein
MHLIKAGGKRYLEYSGKRIRAEWDRQGNLAVGVRQQLQEDGWSVSQATITYQDEIGPGKHGEVQHYITVVSNGNSLS